MKILVCGGRDFKDYGYLSYVLDGLATAYSKYSDSEDNWLPLDILIINGGARGADKMSSDWATSNYVKVKEYPADWDSYGKSAGMIRNKKMLDLEEPDVVVAFPGGKGTDGMVKLARDRGYLVIDKRKGVQK